MAASNAQADKGSRLFVCNIDYQTTESQLRELMSSVGPVSFFRLMPDQNNPSQHRGYAFVEYADAALTGAAIRRLHDATLNGRNIRVDYQDPQIKVACKQRILHGQEQEFRMQDLQWLIESYSAEAQREMVVQLQQIYTQQGDGLRRFLKDHPELAQFIAQLLCAAEVADWREMKPGMAAPLQQKYASLPTPSPPPHQQQQQQQHYPQHHAQYYQHQPSPPPASYLPLPPPPAPVVSVDPIAHLHYLGLGSQEYEQLRQIYNMTPEYIRTLPQADQHSINLLREHFASKVR